MTGKGQDEIGVAMNVNETRRDNEPIRRDNGFALRGIDRADLLDSPLRDAYICVEPGASRPVDHLAILDDNVKHGDRLLVFNFELLQDIEEGRERTIRYLKQWNAEPTHYLAAVNIFVCVLEKKEQKPGMGESVARGFELLSQRWVFGRNICIIATNRRSHSESEQLVEPVYLWFTSRAFERSDC